MDGPKHFSVLRGNRCCRALFTNVLVCLDHDSLLVMWTPRNFKLLTCSTSALSMLMWACSSLLFLVHDHLLCHIEGEVVVLPPHCQVSDLLPSRALPCSHGTKHIPLRGPSIED